MLKNKTYFARYAWFYLIYNFYVVLGGAYVRATGSGAGCGAHWPLCKGELIPTFSILHTVIEFTHRASSGLVTIGGILLLTWAFTAFPKGNSIRKSSIFVFIFILIEALLGALLVLFSLVANNSSNFRALMMALHLAATFMLLASISLTAAWSSGMPVFKTQILKKNITLVFLILVGVLIVASTGAITALGDTLFHPLYVGEGLISDIEYKSSVLKSIRIYHPVFAILISFFTTLGCWKLLRQHKTLFNVNFCKIITGLFSLQVFLGLLNIALLAPITMQIIHLFVADLLWVFIILFLNSVLSKD